MFQIDALTAKFTPFLFGTRSNVLMLLSVTSIFVTPSIEGTTHYPSSRIIMILAAFEREYRNIFGQDCGRSDEYIETKQMVVDLIDRYEKSQHGKKRRYANQLKNYVEKRDNSYDANVKKALTDCEAILSVFARRRYEGTYSVVTDGIAERMGIIRNGIAHSHIDLHFDAVHLSDIKIIEELIYAMRLKKSRLIRIQIIRIDAKMMTNVQLPPNAATLSATRSLRRVCNT